jgi:hypothetical protein
MRILIQIHILATHIKVIGKVGMLACLPRGILRLYLFGSFLGVLTSANPKHPMMNIIFMTHCSVRKAAGLAAALQEVRRVTPFAWLR